MALFLAGWTENVLLRVAQELPTGRERVKVRSYWRTFLTWVPNMRRFADVDELKHAKGEVLGESGWLTVTQEMIDRFAEATGDYQWIHVDRERARLSPFGTTIAHGFLTLSLIPQLLDQVYAVEKVAARLNYGCNKVRFTQPVPSGSRIRARIKLLDVEDTAKGVRITSEAAVMIDNAERPACIAELVAVVVPDNGSTAA